MHFTLSSLATALVFTGLAAGTPLAQRDTPPDRFYLQTKVVGDNKDCGSDKDGLWVYSSHTGAGLGDAGLSSNKSVAWEGFLNGTQQYFTYTGSIAPWPLGISYGPYQGWSVVTISVSEAPPEYQGFFYNSSGLQYNETNGGWLACDWWHGAPQLFSLSSFQYGPLATACSKVELHPVAI